MNSEMFENLVKKLSSLIKKQDTHLRDSISPAERLAVTLRHLATGETQESLSYTFRLGQSTISGIIKDTSHALISVLQEQYLKFPDNELSWKVIAHDYMDRWNFPNCLGAMDGKHCLIDPPLKSGSSYFNYKEQFSIVLLGLVDAQLRFIYVDVGTNGRVSDKGIWNKCDLKQHLEKNDIHVPPPNPLPDTDQDFPYVIVGDEGFALSTNVLIPFPKEQCTGRRERRIYNYRLSRARRCAENAFGVMASRFNILRSPMRYDPDDARNIVLAICCLHNMLRSHSVGRAMYTPPGYIDMESEMTGQIQHGEWREQGHSLLNFQHQGGNRHTSAAIQMRETLCNYFNNVGRVPWQDQAIQ
ncbi:protein ANTAGONIST OF LIKE HETEROCHROMATIN PROTEIN 1 isoform X2 [Solenopsis invicta]|nr:protein ANTAGONIST OF LIKE HETEROCHROMATIN PROTEIN 1 isoform X2 [Solenopsis invicta]